MGAPGGSGQDEHAHRQASLAFEEYRMLVEDMGKLSDRRQMINTLFVSINAIFLTGVGYLLYKFGQAFGDNNQVLFFTAGFLAIAIITTFLNDAWSRIGRQYRVLVNLRIRYLEQIEAFLRKSVYFPTFEIPLKGREYPPAPNAKKELIELPPPGMYNHVSRHVDRAEEPGVQQWNDDHPDPNLKASVEQKRWMDTRGAYTLEGVLYGNPIKKYKAASFTDSEQRIVATFTWAYWVTFAVSLCGLILLVAEYQYHFSILFGPFKL